MKSVHFITFLFLLVTITGCLPDSLTKWDAEEPNTIVSPSTVSIQVNGEEVQVGEATGGTAPAAIQLSATVGSREVQEFSSENELSKNKVNVVLNESFSLAPSFEGETDSSNSYYFSLSEINASGEKSRFDYSLYDLKFDSKTGVLSGEPEKYIPSKKLSLDAYHVESGSWLSLPFNFVAATSFDIENAKVYYPISKDYDSYYIIEVDDISSFNVCKSDTSSSPCITSDNGITAFVEHINEDEKKLFLTITNTLTNDLPEHETLEDALTIDNSNDFVSSDANIVSVTRIFKRCVGTDSNCSRKLVPKFNFSLNAADNELAALEWSITPIPNGGIATNNSPFETEIGFIEESTGEDSGSIIIPNKANELAAKEFTVNVKNPLGETLTTKINLSITQAPSNLGVGNLYLLTLDETNEFRIGNYISSNNPSNARGKVIDKIGSNQLAIQLLNGDLNTGDHVDLLKKFSRKRGVVLHKTLFNAVLTVDDSLGATSLNENDPQKNEYRNIISQDHLINENSHPQDFAFQSHGVIKGKKSSITSITVYGGAHQFSPGLQVVQMGEGASCENGDGIPTTGAVGTIISIGRNPYGGPGDKTDKDENIFINVLSGTFQKNKPIQIGGSYYDCTTTSVDMVKSVSNNLELSQVFVLASGESQFSISNPNEIPDELKINSGTTSDKRLISVWSPNVSFKSINEAGKWYTGDDISTRSHIPGVITSTMNYTESGVSGGGSTGLNETGQVVTAHFNQIGFLFASFDNCPAENVTELASSPCRADSTAMADRNPGRGDQGDGDPEFIFSKGNIYDFSTMMNRSSYNVSEKGYEDNGMIATDGVTTEILSRDDPQIKELKTTHHYTFYTREPMVLKSELQYGDEVVYELTPKWLPEGLEFDAKTGTLSGIPTEFVVKTNYTITAKNPIGEASSSFSMEIKDHFSVSIPMSFIDAESYILHQSGQGNQSTNCRITSEQIDGNNQEVKDILCYLEAGEMDLFFFGMELEYNVGKSMCEYITFDPYTQVDSRYTYIKTGSKGRHSNGTDYSTISEVQKVSGKYAKINRIYEYSDSCQKCYVPEIDQVVDCSTLPTEEEPGVKCESNYSAIFNDGGDHPNCDDGYYVDRVIKIGNDSLELSNGAVIKDGICGGKNAIGGSFATLIYVDVNFMDDEGYGAIDSNNDGQITIEDDMDNNGFIDLIFSPGSSEWLDTLSFSVPCEDGVSTNNTYDISDNTNPKKVTFSITGTDCTEDKLGNSPGSTVEMDIFSPSGTFETGELSYNGTSYSNIAGTPKFYFFDTNNDGEDDSIAYAVNPTGSSTVIDYTTLESCTKCIDADDDGKFDYVDFNNDGIADDIINAVGDSGTDGWGDHTITNVVTGNVDRADSIASEIKNNGNEELISCGGDPKACLKGSNNMLLSHDWERSGPAIPKDTIYGVGIDTEEGNEVFKFQAPIQSPNPYADNNYIANYSKANSCGISPLIIHQSSAFYSENGYNKNTDGLDTSFNSNSAGKSLYLNSPLPALAMDTLSDDSLFWEILTSYSNDSFYSGLGDLLFYDIEDLVEDDIDGDGPEGIESDFDPSITLPYVYKKNYTREDANTTLGQNPIAGIKSVGSNNEYELITFEKDYDSNYDKKEITYYESGYKNLAKLSKATIWSFPVSAFDQTGNLSGLSIILDVGNNTFKGIILEQTLSSISIAINYSNFEINQDNLKTIFSSGEKIQLLGTIGSIDVATINTSDYLPYQVRFGKYNSGSSTNQAQPFYTFNCLDAARDLKARIRVQVREWDRVFTAGHDLDKTIPSSLMDDSSIDVWEEDFDNRPDGDSVTRTYNSCLNNIPTKLNTTKSYNPLPVAP